MHVISTCIPPQTRYCLRFVPFCDLFLKFVLILHAFKAEMVQLRMRTNQNILNISNVVVTVYMSLLILHDSRICDVDDDISSS